MIPAFLPHLNPVRKLRRSRSRSLPPSRPGVKLQVEVLEDRCVPTTVTNAVSHFPIKVDGQFTPGGEWSDVIPLAFHSPTSPGDKFQEPGPGAPANSLLYASLAVPDPAESTASVDDGIYLMYDYAPRTNPTFAPGEFVADITFPVTLPGNTQEQVITVQFRGGRPDSTGKGGPAFTISVDLDQDGKPDLSAQQLDLQGAVGFGPSALSPVSHLLVELEVPLHIPAGFASPGSPLPGNGINPATGLYDPNPQFWTGGFAGDPTQPKAGSASDPPGSSALFRINPDGSVTATAQIVDHIVNVQSSKPVNLKSNGLVAINILSSATFDATKIDLSSLTVNGKSLSSLGLRVVQGDVNGDGRADLTLEFHAGDLTAALGADLSTLVFTGSLNDGSTFGGSVSLSLVPKKH